MTENQQRLFLILWCLRSGHFKPVFSSSLLPACVVFAYVHISILTHLHGGQFHLLTSSLTSKIPSKPPEHYPAAPPREQAAGFWIKPPLRCTMLSESSTLCPAHSNARPASAPTRPPFPKHFHTWLKAALQVNSLVLYKPCSLHQRPLQGLFSALQQFCSCRDTVCKTPF